MITLKSINIQVNSSEMLAKLNSNIVFKEEENAIVIYDDNSRKDVFYPELTQKNKTIWDSYIDMCINKVGISKDNLGQIINQYDIERIIINTIDILVDSSKQFIVYLNELTNEEMLSLNNFKEMIKNTRIN
jgi:hypothetical protein